MKEILKRILGDVILGMYDYWSKPEQRYHWGGAFNGQSYRTSIYRELVDKLDIRTVVETGSYRGDTTELFSNTVDRVFTVEFLQRNYGFTKARFLFNSNIRVTCGDSRDFLTQLAVQNTATSDPIFFYLDAHWREDLPLAEELRIICKHWPHCIIMIDDFEVPGTSYGFDDYGPGNSLTLSYVIDALNCSNEASTQNARYFFPSLDESHETGAKRGCLVMSNCNQLSDQIEAMNTLVRYHSESET